MEFPRRRHRHLRTGDRDQPRLTARDRGGFSAGTADATVAGMRTPYFAALLVAGGLIGGCSKDQPSTLPESALPTESDPTSLATPPTPETQTALAQEPEPTSQILFGFNSVQLEPAALSLLDNVATWVKANPERTILVQGHADKTGDADYNLGLSARRAQEVSSYLTSKGVDGKQIIMSAVGEIASEPAGMSNRRVLILATTVETTN